MLFKKMRELLLLVYLSNLTCYAKKYHPSFLTEDEIDHRRFIREDSLQPCNEDNLMNFLAEIQVINPESIIKLATLDEITPSCKRVEENLEKIKDYLKGCNPPNQSDLYYQLIKGVESLHDKLCTESPFKKQFQEIHKCVYELRNDLEDCEGPADWNENSDNSAVCKAYKNISDCYYIKTAKVCGKKSASLMKELLEAIIDSILTISCDNVKANPEVKDAMPDDYLKSENRGSLKQLSLLKALEVLTFALFIL